MEQAPGPLQARALQDVGQFPGLHIGAQRLGGAVKRRHRHGRGQEIVAGHDDQKGMSSSRLVPPAGARLAPSRAAP